MAENRNTEMACGRRANRQKQRMQTALIEPRLLISAAPMARIGILRLSSTNRSSSI